MSEHFPSCIECEADDVFPAPVPTSAHAANGGAR